MRAGRSGDAVPERHGRIRLVGPGGRRYHYLAPLYARRLGSASLDGASLVLSLGGMAWSLAASVPSSARHIGYVGGAPRPLYGHTADYIVDYPGPLRPLLRSAVPALHVHHRRLLRRPSRLLSNSRSSARSLEAIAGRPVDVVYPPTRTSFFTPAVRRRGHFLAVARLNSNKRLDVLIEAFRHLR
jgi:glycosyltransferase involved in cell wall biosynthesis